MKIAVLWAELSGYLNGCLRALASRPGVELLVVHEASKPDVPFDAGQFSWIRSRVEWHDTGDFAMVETSVDRFAPDVAVICGWHMPLYRRLARRLAGRCYRVMTMDNCWTATVRQRLGSLVSPVYVRPLADAAWVPGERQVRFARRMGFAQHQIAQGMLSGDYDALAEVDAGRIRDGGSPRDRFLYVGRLAEEKGITALAEAYQRYRAASRATPWPLTVCGSGPLRSGLEGMPGVELRGFVQPADLPGLYREAGCFVMPSLWDHWCVAVHEAASAGLPIIATSAVGSVPHLVRNGLNGYVVRPNDPAVLAWAMQRASAVKADVREAQARASRVLARQYTPTAWVDTLLGISDGHRPEPLR